MTTPMSRHPSGHSFDLSCASGTTLIEVLIAMLILVSGVLAMAQLFLMAAVTNTAARRTTAAAIVASQKMEELRARTSLEPSPGASLERNTPGLVDHVDARGRVVGTGEFPPGDAVYTRRWAIDMLPGGGGFAIRVLVLPIAASAQRAAGRAWGEARLISIAPRMQP